MANVFVSGLAGRVRIGGGNTVVAGITSWTLEKVAADIPFPHFESTADSDGTIWPAYQVGLAGATGTIEGYHDIDSTNKTEAGTGISVGLSASLDLVLFKTTPWGYTNVPVIFTGFSTGSNIENQPAKFRASFRVNGDPAKATTVT
jgi:hypothetical protein